HGLRSLINRSTLALQGMALLAAGPLLVAPAAILPLFRVPARPDLLAAWCWLAVSIQISMTSAPSGHHLNATRHIERHALLSGLFLVIGVGAGILALVAWGVAGAGVMRFAIDAPLAWARMGLSNRWVRWIGVDGGRLVAGQLAMLVLLAAALLALRWPVTVALWLAVVFWQLPIVIDLARPSRSAAGP
ncbi:MAG TPA: hypothetical protein VFB67_01750, partial [Candidatus Polarisedimenticolaceae bacterium]|nr:hypothetical protein [Candidatus Polarisedimenticolaceae bacterium]